LLREFFYTIKTLFQEKLIAPFVAPTGRQNKFLLQQNHLRVKEKPRSATTKRFDATKAGWFGTHLFAFMAIAVGDVPRVFNFLRWPVV
jgi:hypothetical protein